MYVPPELVAKGAAESLELINSFIKIAENLRKDKKTAKGIADVISQLETDAYVMSGEFIRQIQLWRKSLKNAKIDLSKKFGDVEKTSKYWKNRHDKAMEAFDPSLDAVRDRLCGFIDDLIAIARCAGKEEILALSAEEGAKLKEKIRADTDLKNHTMEEILETLVQQAQRFRGVLGTKKTLPR